MGKVNQMYQDEIEHMIEEYDNDRITEGELIDFMRERWYDPDTIQDIISEKQETTMLKSNKLNMNLIHLTAGYHLQIKHVIGGAIALLVLIAVNISF